MQIPPGGHSTFRLPVLSLVHNWIWIGTGSASLCILCYNPSPSGCRLSVCKQGKHVEKVILPYASDFRPWLHFSCCNYAVYPLLRGDACLLLVDLTVGLCIMYSMSDL